MKKQILIFSMLLATATFATAQQLYLCGEAPIGNGWGPTQASQVPMTLAEDGKTNTVSLDIVGEKWFCVSTQGSAIEGNDDEVWADFNNNYRYSCSTFNDNNKTNGTYVLDQQGDHANQLVTGHYEISIDATTMKMTITYTAPVVDETTYTVVGDPEIGLKWEPLDTDLVMEKKSENVYELKLEGATVTPKANGYYWRIIVDGKVYGWKSANKYGASGKNGDGDDNLNTPSLEAGVYDITFTLDLSKGDASVPTIDIKKKDVEIKYDYLYVKDQSGFEVLNVYGYDDDKSELLGNWPGASVTGEGSETEEIGGVTYYKVKFLPQEGTYHLIFFSKANSDINDDPTRIYKDLELNSSEDKYFVTVGEVSSSPEEENTATAISGATISPEEDGQAYNLLGQPVDANYKGIVVKNGVKYIQK